MRPYYYPPKKPEPIVVFNRSTGREEPLVVGDREVMSDAVSIELAEVPFCRLRDVVQFVAPGQYTEDTLSLTQQALNDYAKQMQEQYMAQIASGAEDRFPEIIGQSDGILAVKEQIRQFAPYDLPVLITGPTGSGKELVAAELHKANERVKKENMFPLTARRWEVWRRVNCLGHEKGAFTDAREKHRGYFKQADGGTAISR